MRRPSPEATPPESQDNRQETTNRPKLKFVQKIQQNVSFDLNSRQSEFFYELRNFQGKSRFFKKYRIDADEEAVGDGTYSICVKCYAKDTGKQYAVKIMSLLHDASHEIEALETCQGHSNVVQLVEHMEDNAYLYIVFELLNGGELFSRIRECNSFPEAIARSYFNQLVQAIDYMHTRGIVHRDLKPENIMFVDRAETSQLKIVDFGFARKKSSEETPPCFTLDYAAPESLLKGTTKESRDLWSLGVILYTMVCGNTPFMPSNVNKQSDEKNYRLQLTEKIRNGTFNRNCPAWDNLSKTARDLITSLLKVDEAERLTLEDVLVHPWVQTANDSDDETDSDRSHYRKCVEDDLEPILVDDDSNDLPPTSENETHEEICSNDSSGIVLSERNEGSSLSSNVEVVEEILHPEPPLPSTDIMKSSRKPEISPKSFDEPAVVVFKSPEQEAFAGFTSIEQEDEQEPCFGFAFDNASDWQIGLWKLCLEEDRKMQESLKVNVEEATPKIIEVPRRPRGRPKVLKVPKPEPQEAKPLVIKRKAAAPPENVPVPKRPRGRPKKEPVEAPVITQPPYVVYDFVSAPPKRGRGRKSAVVKGESVPQPAVVVTSLAETIPVEKTVRKRRTKKQMEEEWKMLEEKRMLKEKRMLDAGMKKSRPRRKAALNFTQIDVKPEKVAAPVVQFHAVPLVQPRVAYSSSPVNAEVSAPVQHPPNNERPSWIQVKKIYWTPKMMPPAAQVKRNC